MLLPGGVAYCSTSRRTLAARPLAGEAEREERRTRRRPQVERRELVGGEPADVLKRSAGQLPRADDVPDEQDPAPSEEARRIEQLELRRLAAEDRVRCKRAAREAENVAVAGVAARDPDAPVSSGHRAHERQ